MELILTLTYLLLCSVREEILADVDCTSPSQVENLSDRTRFVFKVLEHYFRNRYGNARSYCLHKTVCCSVLEQFMEMEFIISVCMHTWRYYFDSRTLYGSRNGIYCLRQYVYMKVLFFTVDHFMAIEIEFIVSLYMKVLFFTVEHFMAIDMEWKISLSLSSCLCKKIFTFQ